MQFRAGGTRDIGVADGQIALAVIGEVEIKRRRIAFHRGQHHACIGDFQTCDSLGRGIFDRGFGSVRTGGQGKPGTGEQQSGVNWLHH